MENILRRRKPFISSSQFNVGKDNHLGKLCVSDLLPSTCSNQIENLFYDFGVFFSWDCKSTHKMNSPSPLIHGRRGGGVEAIHTKWKSENVCRIDVGFYVSINRYAKNVPVEISVHSFCLMVVCFQAGGRKFKNLQQSKVATLLNKSNHQSGQI